MNKKWLTPTRKSRRKNGSKKAAPPFLNTKNGNLHTFPKPIIKKIKKN